MSTKLQTTRLSKAMLIGALLLPTLAPAQTAYSWMSPDVKNAWTQGYKGQGTTITVVDDFSNSSRFSGNLGTGVLNQGHGYWTALEAAMIAPEAKVVKRNWSSTSVALNPSGLNVLNLSYGMYARSNLDVNRIAWSGQEKSIISYAKGGTAVVVKAAGNDAVAVGKANRSGNVDYLNVALRGAPAVIYAGALSSNGTTAAKASLASYSNYAGTDKTIQNNFLVVGVASNQTGLAGTSFAAPIISGYAAVVGSKFTKATSTQIVNQLLTTARTDTIRNYQASLHGRGEASLSRALAPVSIR